MGVWAEHELSQGLWFVFGDEIFFQLWKEIGFATVERRWSWNESHSNSLELPPLRMERAGVRTKPIFRVRVAVIQYGVVPVCSFDRRVILIPDDA